MHEHVCNRCWRIYYIHPADKPYDSFNLCVRCLTFKLRELEFDFIKDRRAEAEAFRLKQSQESRVDTQE